MRRALLPFALAAAATVVLTTCTDDTGPGHVRTAQLALVPRFEAGASGIVPIARVQATLTRVADGAIAKDTLVTVSPTDSIVDLQISVPVLVQGEQFELVLRLYTPTSALAFQGGPILVTPTTSGTPTPIDVPLAYVGTGANAAGVVITPDIVEGIGGDTVRFTAIAFDSAEAPIPNTPIAWRSEDTARAVVARPDSGRFVLRSVRGWVHIVAELLTGPSDTADIFVWPAPTAIAADSGSGQSSVAGTILPQPLVARVTAADGLGVEGVWVRFAPASGSGTVTPDSVLTDTAGRARTWWTLGPSAGTHTVTATTARLGSSSATFTATAVGPTGRISWINPAGGNWSVGANWSTGSPPGPTDTAAITLAGTYGVRLDVPANVTALLLGGSPGNGSQSLDVGAQTLTLTGGALMAPTGDLVLNGGTVAVSPDVVVRVDGVASWSGGAFQGPGLLAINAGGTLVMSGSAKSMVGGFSVLNQGTGTWTAGDLTIGDGGRFWNDGRLEIPGDVRLQAGTGNAPLFLNRGQLERLVSTGTVTFNLPFENGGAGLLDVRTGTVSLAGATTLGGGVYLGRYGTGLTAAVLSLDGTTALTQGLTVTDTSGSLSPGLLRFVGNVTSQGRVRVLSSYELTGLVTVEPDTLELSGISRRGTGSGTFNVQAGAVLHFGYADGDDLGPGSQIIGGGTVLVTGYAITAGRYDVARTEIVGNFTGFGRLDYNGSDTARTGVARIEGGATLAGTGVFQVSDSLTIASSTMEGFGGVTRIAPGAVMVVDSATSSVLDMRVLRNAGTLILPASTLHLRGGSVRNDTAGTLDLRSGASLSREGNPSVTNYGLLRASGTTTANTIAGALFDNEGTLDVQSGTLQITAGWFLHGDGAVLQGAGTLAVAATTYDFNGDVRPGTSPGILTLAGDMPQTALSTLAIELGGTSPGTGYDRLNVTGSATLGGALAVSLVNGFTPGAGQQFTVLTFGSRSGGFGSMSLPTLPTPLVWDTTFTATDLTLAVRDTSSSVNQWVNAAGGDWSTAANWSRNRVPLATDSVAIDLAGSYVVTLGTTTSVANMRLGGPGSTPTLRLASVNVASLTVADGFTNAGTIELTDLGFPNPVATLTVTAGTLVNYGMIVTGAMWGGERTITAAITNLGLITAGGANLTVQNAGRTFATDAGALILDPGRTLAVTGGTFTIGGETQIMGSGTIALAAGTAVDLTSDFLLPVGRTWGLELGGVTGTVTISGPGALIVADALDIGSDVVNAPLDIRGVVTTGYDAAINGSLTLAAAGRLRLAPIAAATVTVANGFTNNGTIELTDAGYPNPVARLTVTSGMLVNAGTITTAAAWGGTRFLNATTLNQGTIAAVGAPLTVANTGRVFATQGGTLGTGAGQTVTVSGGTAVFGSGTQLTGTGTVSLPAGTGLTLASDFTLPAGNYRLDLAGTNGISVNGPGALIMGDTLDIAADTVNAPFVVQGVVQTNYNARVNGAMNVASGGLLRVAAVGAATLGVAGDLTNAGTIELGDLGYPNPTTALVLGEGHLVNTGTITTTFISGGTRTIDAQLYNYGTVNLQHPLTVWRLLMSPVPGTITGNGSTLSVAGLDVNSGTFDNTPLVSTGGIISRFDHVTFQNMNPAAIQLTINHPGPAIPFSINGVFNEVRFLTTPTTGRYIRANDTDTGDGTPLAIDMVGSTPADGSAYEEELNGAVINWIPVGGINDWVGGSGLWTEAAHWSLARAPIPGDTVRIIGAGDYTVTMDASATVAKLLLGGTADPVTLNASGWALTITDPGPDPGLEILPFGRIVLSESGLLADRLTNAGTIAAGGSLIQSSDFTNLGTLEVQWGELVISHPTSYDLQTSGTVLVDDGARLTLNSNGALTYLGGTIAGGAASTGVIRLLPNVSLVLGADLTYNNLIIESIDGSVIPQAAQQLTVGQFAEFRASGPGVTQILAPVVANGVVDIRSGQLRLGATASLNTTGVLRGTGVLDGTGLTGAGALAGSINPGDQPGALAGILTWVGDFAPDPPAVLNIDIGGTQAGTEHDRLDVSGAVELDATLHVSLRNDFTPTAGQRFPIMTFASSAFSFATLQFPTVTGLVFDTLTVVDRTFPDTLYVVAQSAIPTPIAFAGDSASGLSTGVFSVNGDGTALDRLVSTTFTGTNYFYPRWAPDRSRVGFSLTSPTAGADFLTVVSADGTETATVVSDLATRLPRWSPDGVHLAYQCGEGNVMPYNEWHVCIITDATGTVPSLDGRGNGTGKVMVSWFDPTYRLNGVPAFAWNPTNSNQLAFVRDSAGAANSSRIYLVTYSGGQWLRTPVSPDFMDAGAGPLTIQGSWLDWSPNGQRLVFMATAPQETVAHIYAINVDGTGLTQLTTGSYPDDQPQYSPNGAEILFTRNSGCSFDAWVMNADGSNPQRITYEQVCDFQTWYLGYDWSPDGQEIVVTGFDTPHNNLLIYKVPRTTREGTYFADRVLVGRGATGPSQVRDIQPSWRP